MRGVAWNCEIIDDDVTTGTGTGTLPVAAVGTVVGSDGKGALGATTEGFVAPEDLVGCCRASLGSLGRIVDPPVEGIFT